MQTTDHFGMIRLWGLMGSDTQNDTMRLAFSLSPSLHIMEKDKLLLAVYITVCEHVDQSFRKKRFIDLSYNLRSKEA